MLRKKLRAVSALLLSLVLILPLLVSCGNGKQVETTSAPASSNESSKTDTSDIAPDYSGMLQIVTTGKSDYQIVRPDRTSKAIKSAFIDLGKAIKEKTDVEPVMVTDFERLYPVSEFEIVIGNTKRNGSVFNYDTSLLGEYDCEIKVIDNRIVILGGSDIAVAMGVYHFIDNIVKYSETKDIVIKNDFSCKLSRDTVNTTSVKVMTQNLLGNDTEYANIDNYESTYSINVRTSRIRKIIENNRPDVIGLQECNNAWRKYFDSIESSTGYKRIGASKNPKIGILYDSSKWKPVENKSFWLSPKPETQKDASEWANGQSVIERLGMYVVFESLETGERFIHFNVHIGFETGTLSTNQTKVILDKIEQLTKKYDYPIAVTGDCNFNSSSTQYKLMTSGSLYDSKHTAKISEGAGSFNNLTADDHHSLPVDQIFVSLPGWIVNSYKVDYTRIDGMYASDHFAVVAELEIFTKY